LSQKTFQGKDLSLRGLTLEDSLSGYEVGDAVLSNRLVFDIETDGFNPTKIHCIGIRSLAFDDEVTIYTDDDDSYPSLERAYDRLLNADYIIGHNIYGFDLRVLAKLGRSVFGKIRPNRSRLLAIPAALDTLALTRCATGDMDVNACAGLRMHDWQLFAKGKLSKELVKSHSLKAWGQRLGFNKKEFEDFSGPFTPEMGEYCARDVEVNYELVRFFDPTEFTAWENETRFHYWIGKMVRNGIPFNRRKAETLAVKLVGIRDKIDAELQVEFPPEYEEMKTPQYWINTQTGVKYLTKSATPKNEHKYLERGPNKQREVSFNPGSRQQIAQRLISKYGWEPEKFTPSGLPEVSEVTLTGLPWTAAKLLNEYLVIQKRMGMIADGDNAWLKVEKDGRIHGQVNPCGANGGRCTHFKPNLAQITAPRSPYGKEMRECFEAPYGWSFFGMDLSGIELRMLAHFLAPLDKGDYIEQILKGDIHSYNRDQAAKHLPWLKKREDSRDIAKTLIYATIYGGGPTAIGAVVGGGRRIGKQLQDAFFKGIPALPVLIDRVKAKYKQDGYLTGIDGRRLYPRSDHSALNTLLQSSAALVMKFITSVFNEITEGMTMLQMVAHVHDEFQCIFKNPPLDYDWTKTEDGALPLPSFDLLKKICEDVAIQATQMFDLRIPITVECRSGKTWADTH
jgi:DNA polymerase I